MNKITQIIFTIIAVALVLSGVFIQYVARSTLDKPILVQNPCYQMDDDSDVCDSDKEFLTLDSKEDFNEIYCYEFLRKGYCIPYVNFLAVGGVVFYVLAAIFGHRHHKKKFKKNPA